MSAWWASVSVGDVVHLGSLVLMFVWAVSSVRGELHTIQAQLREHARRLEHVEATLEEQSRIVYGISGLLGTGALPSPRYPPAG